MGLPSGKSSVESPKKEVVNLKAIKRRLYLYAGACLGGTAVSLLFLISPDRHGQSGRLPLLLLLLASILSAVLSVRVGRRLSAASLIVENQILHIESAAFQTRHTGKPEQDAEVYVSCFGLLLDSKIIKFNQEGIRLKAVEIGGYWLSLDYGTDTITRKVRLHYTGVEIGRLEDIVERFRYETGVLPVLKERDSGPVLVEWIRCGAANCYLLTGSGGSILADACISSDAARIYRRIKKRNVRLIVLTHGHPDHIGAAAELARRLHVPIAMSRKDAALLEAPAGRTLHSHTFFGRILALSADWSLRPKAAVRLVPDIWLEDGQDLTEYGVEARVVSLSGHTEGSVGLLADGDDFIVGDALFHILRPTAAMLYENREQMEKSIERILRSGAGYLYPGHGSPFPVEKFTRSGDIPSLSNLL